jgi:ABC-type multidrug transport system fused ATPase/permease subunit
MVIDEFIYLLIGIIVLCIISFVVFFMFFMYYKNYQKDIITVGYVGLFFRKYYYSNRKTTELNKIDKKLEPELFERFLRGARFSSLFATILFLIASIFFIILTIYSII